METGTTDRDELIAITKSIPLLAGNGIGVTPGSRDETMEQRQAHFHADRQTMLDPHENTVKAFSTAKRWIKENVEQTKRITAVYGTSYGVKHRMSADTGVYANNGTFIAAMVACGYRWKRSSHTSPNVIFNWRGKKKKN